MGRVAGAGTNGVTQMGDVTQGQQAVRVGRPAGAGIVANVLDVVVVGAGAAGLAAARVLARAGRLVAVVGAGESSAARSEVERSGGVVLDGTVEAVEHGFFVHLVGGAVLRARRVLVATGARDEVPDLPGLAGLRGSDALVAPDGDGHEVRDRALGVLGAGAGAAVAVERALEARQWSPDVVLFTDGAELSLADHERLAARGVEAVAGRVSGVVLDGDRLLGVRVGPADPGRVVARQALVLSGDPVPRSGLLLHLGCATDADGRTATTADGRTSVDGVWAAGGVTGLRIDLAAATAAGATAARAIDQDLRAEDVDRAVEAYRADGGVYSAAMERRVSEAVLGRRWDTL